MAYCSTHGIEYSGYNCPRCEAQERHDEAQERQRELLDATEEGIKETVDALLDSEYRRANPGDYKCPHCKYISLKNNASRCPLCHGEIGSDYWNTVRAWEKAEAEKELAKAAARAAAEAEYIRTAPEREAAAKAELIRTAPAREAAARAERQIRRNEASSENAKTGAGIGATLGGIVIGFAGLNSCLNNYKAVRGGVTDFNLFNGLFYGAIGGAVIGLVLGALIGQLKD